MTFREWLEDETKFPGETRSSHECAYDAGYDAGQASGFSLGTEAAAKLFDYPYPECRDDLVIAGLIRELRYEDVKGEKDG
jgi:hypothetical protein